MTAHCASAQSHGHRSGTRTAHSASPFLAVTGDIGSPFGIWTAGVDAPLATRLGGRGRESRRAQLCHWTEPQRNGRRGKSAPRTSAHASRCRPIAGQATTSIKPRSRSHALMNRRHLTARFATSGPFACLVFRVFQQSRIAEVFVPKKRANVKNEKQYEALKDKGMSKERAARIANSPDASKKGGESKGGSRSSSKQGGTTAQKKAAGRKGGKATARKPSS
jgi:hypothetical protein